MYQSHRFALSFHSRITAACDAISSLYGAADSGASTGASPKRLIFSVVTDVYPSSPTGQIASPMRS